MSDEDVVRHEGYDSRTCLRCGKRGEDTPEGRLHYSKFNNGNFCRGCAGHPSPTAPSGAEPRSGDTPPGAGADLLPGPCAICGLTNYPLSFGGPTICPSCDCGDSGPYVISRQATELRRLAAEVERLRGAMRADDERLRQAETRVWPGTTHGCDAPEWMADEILTLRATQQAAAEQMRQDAAELVERFAVNLGGNGEHKPLIEDVRDGSRDAVRQAYARAIRALPLPSPDLDAIRAAARAEGFKQGSNIAIDLAQQEAERRGAERALEVVEAMRENGECDLRQVIHRLRALFPATLGGTP